MATYAAQREAAKRRTTTPEERAFDAETLYTAAQAAKFARMSPAALRHHIRQGHIKSIVQPFYPYAHMIEPEAIGDFIRDHVTHIHPNLRKGGRPKGQT